MQSTSGRQPLRTFWLALFLVGSALAGAGFCYKLYEFFWDVSSTEGFEFAGVHLVTYLLVAGGFFLLLVHGFLRGHFADIERPKYDLLEQERQRDHQEFD
jgi:hypothetical protein